MSVKPVTASPDDAASMQRTILAVVAAGCEDMAEKYNAAPLSTVCMLADQAAFAIADLDRTAGLAYLRALIEIVETHGTAAQDDAYRRKDAAFDALAAANVLHASTPEGSA